MSPKKSSKQRWVVKVEPDVYPYEKLEKDGKTRWDGVRNFMARNHMRAMKKGDEVLYYHTGDVKSVVGVATVLREAYPDPTAEDGDWVAVDLAPLRRLDRAVPLAELKADPKLAEMRLVRVGRLSVSPATEEEFANVIGKASLTTRGKKKS